MDLKIIFLFLTTITAINGQIIECSYYGSINNDYRCSLFIINIHGYDGFENIAGEHINGANNDHVKTMRTDTVWTTRFPSIICSQFKNLEWLTFNSRTGYDITNLSLENCKNLNFLHLTDIKSIEPEAFKNLNHVTNLLLQGVGSSGFIDIPQKENLFSAMTKLEHLQIYANFEFHPLAFRGVKSVKTIFINGNFSVWHREWFSEMDFVQLDFSGHGFKEIPLNAIGSVVYLRISSNTLEFLDGGSFGSLENLEQITLTCKNVNAIDSRIFTKPTKLTRVIADTACSNGFSVFEFDRHVEGFLTLLENCTNNLVVNADTNPDQPFTWLSAPLNGLQVEVRAISDAYVALSSSTVGTFSAQLEIQFGTDGNTRTKIVEDGVTYVDVSSPGILSSSVFKTLRIGWNNGAIAVYREGDIFPFLVHYMKNQFDVNFYGLRTLYSIGSWRIERIN